MKRLLALGASAALLSGCASSVMSGSEPGFAPDQTAFVGWVRFSNGEFQLYADQDQVLQPFSRPCLSGAASRNEMRQAVQDLERQRVRITGRTALWSTASANRIEHLGSDIRNDCGGTFVLLADDIRPAN